MDIAKSIFLGGDSVYAELCDYDSYKKLGLRCISCGEPVFLKKGDVKKPHFAHNIATTDRVFEDCDLRAIPYINKILKTCDELIQDKGQRIEILQNYFFKVVTFSYLIDRKNFQDWINLKYDEDYKNIFKSFQNDCIAKFQNLSEDNFLHFPEILEINNSKEQSLLHSIAIEAIDYLCVKSSLELLAEMIAFCFYIIVKAYKYDVYNKDFIIFCLKEKRIESLEVCHQLIKIIVSNPWDKALNSILTNKLISDEKNNIFTKKLPYEFLPKKYREVTFLILEDLDSFETSLGNFLVSKDVNTSDSFEYNNRVKKLKCSFVEAERYKLNKSGCTISQKTLYFLHNTPANDDDIRYLKNGKVIFTLSICLITGFSINRLHGRIRKETKEIRELEELYAWFAVALETSRTNDNFLLVIMLIAYKRRINIDSQTGADLDDWFKAIETVVDIQQLTIEEHKLLFYRLEKLCVDRGGLLDRVRKKSRSISRNVDK